jgi:hypothetical protein
MDLSFIFFTSRRKLQSQPIFRAPLEKERPFGKPCNLQGFSLIDLTLYSIEAQVNKPSHEGLNDICVEMALHYLVDSCKMEFAWKMTVIPSTIIRSTEEEQTSARPRGSC